ncbi:MAG: hypothetical protein KGJ07_00200 [Patescibacteria group bacterium]|nr:hypothetical protein [Patescibacteria group bacterium]
MIKIKACSILRAVELPVIGSSYTAGLLFMQQSILQHARTLRMIAPDGYNASG